MRHSISFLDVKTAIHLFGKPEENLTNNHISYIDHYGKEKAILSKTYRKT